MKAYRRLARALLLGAGVVAASHFVMPVTAQAQGEPVIAVIDVQQVLQESSAIKAMQSQVEGLRISFQADFVEKERALRDKNQDLERQRGTLSADDFSQKRLDLEAEVMSAQQDFKERKARLDRMLSLALGRVQNKLTEVVRDLAEERGADLVLAKSTVVLVNTDMEITGEALTRLNAQLPIIPLSDLGEQGGLPRPAVLDPRTAGSGAPRRSLIKPGRSGRTTLGVGKPCYFPPLLSGGPGSGPPSFAAAVGSCFRSEVDVDELH